MNDFLETGQVLDLDLGAKRLTQARDLIRKKLEIPWRKLKDNDPERDQIGYISGLLASELDSRLKLRAVEFDLSAKSSGSSIADSRQRQRLLVLEARDPFRQVYRDGAASLVSVKLAFLDPAILLDDNQNLVTDQQLLTRFTDALCSVSDGSVTDSTDFLLIKDDITERHKECGLGNVTKNEQKLIDDIFGNKPTSYGARVDGVILRVIDHPNDFGIGVVIHDDKGKHDELNFSFREFARRDELLETTSV
jgi:hypothetical protein